MSTLGLVPVAMLHKNVATLLNNTSCNSAAGNHRRADNQTNSMIVRMIFFIQKFDKQDVNMKKLVSGKIWPIYLFFLHQQKLFRKAKASGFACHQATQEQMEQNILVLLC